DLEPVGRGRRVRLVRRWPAPGAGTVLLLLPDSVPVLVGHSPGRHGDLYAAVPDRWPVGRRAPARAGGRRGHAAAAGAAVPAPGAGNATAPLPGGDGASLYLDEF